ncbi:MAG: RsmE family RNA methyltransferase [Spirochaetaceae bacterium]|jgi:16S rRNA (uracil1498-N3)-methyltransferase|nr:RsmE family RNA methyltransferase [Spirochaetaceae bacterium]
MKQFILKEAPDNTGLIRLRDRDYHYLVQVRRLKPGSAFTALLPGLETVTIRVRSIGGHILEGEVEPPRVRRQKQETPGRENPTEEVPGLAPGFPSIYLFQALPRGTKMDLIVRQAAEGAVAEIVPFVAEHSIPLKTRGREERWRRIIKEARQQSGSPVDTRLHSPLSEDELFLYWKELRNREPAALGLVLHEVPAHEKEALRPGKETAVREKAGFAPLEQGGFHYYLNTNPSLTVLTVGPEGGFSRAELKRFMDAGFKPLWMGNTVLRTETAALYGAAVVRILLLEKQWWMMKQEPK